MTKKVWSKSEVIEGWRLMHSECPGGPCPTVYRDAEGDVVVQGLKLSGQEKSDLRVPEHEDVVRLPKSFFDELVSKQK